MEQLREEGILLFEHLNKAWIKEIKRAQQDNDGIDMSLNGQFSELLTKFNKCVQECKLRNSKEKKKGFFS